MLKQSDTELFDSHGGQAGDWCFLTGSLDAAGRTQCYISIRLTDAEDGFCILPIVTQGDFADPARAKTDWYWDGNREAPTLEPSILHHSKIPWHGYMRAGKLEVA